MYMNQFSHRAVTKVLVLALLLAPAGIRAQGQATATPGNAADLYRDILNPVLDATQVYTLREVSIYREDLHFSLSD